MQFELEQGGAGGLMLFLSFVELLPESVELLGPFIAQLWFFAGVAIMALVVYFIPGDGFFFLGGGGRWLSDGVLLIQKGDNAMSRCEIQSLIQRSSSLLPVMSMTRQQSPKTSLN